MFINQITRINTFSNFLSSEDLSLISSCNIFFCSLFGILSLSILKIFLISSLDSTNFFPHSSIAFICFLPWSSIVLLRFSKALSRGEYVNFACSITLLWSEGSISSPVRYSYLSILPDDKTDNFAAFMLISYCNYSSLILPLIFIIIFYILSKRFFLTRNYMMQ